jgi:Cu-Zn family superoxide dismutase
MFTRAVVRLLLVLLVLLTGSSVLPAAAQIAPADRASWPTAEWRTAAPESQGMDLSLLDAADARIRAEQPYITSLLVVRGGDLVFEQYYGGFAATETTQLWSATKSVTSTIVGIAIDEGLLTLDQTVGELLPDRIPAEADPRAATVTVRQLLTMTSGFAWTSNTDYQFAYDAVDQTARTLGLPFACDPGTCYEYNSGNVQVLSSIIQALTGQTLAAYAQSRLFDPLGIAPPVWDVSVTGETLGAVGLHLTSRDVAKLGFLLLNGGVWDGQQVISGAWVTAATSVQSSGVNAAGVSVGGDNTGYGYLWWTNTTLGLPGYHAIGLGAQVLYVLPTLDLVAVATTSNAIPNEVPIDQQQDPLAIIEELVVPAATGPVADPGSSAAQVATPDVTEAPTVAATLPPATAAPVSQAALPAATPAGTGRVFALPGETVFPEGIAYDEATGDFYVGSTIDGTIYRGNVATGTVEVFLPGGPGRVALSLALDTAGRLYVAGGETGAVTVYDTGTRQLLFEDANGLAPNTFLNDVAVSPTGDAYVTDSFNPTLLRIPAAAIPSGPGTPASAPTTDALEVFVDFTTTGFDLVQPGFNANGIVATPDGGYLLLVQTNTGSLYRIDVATGETIQVDLGGANLPGGDGLELDGQTLYVVGEGQVTVIVLGADFDSGTVEASVGDPTFATPSDIARVDGCLLVVNSQLDALQGQPQLPFTVFSVPIPNAGAATPVATAC